MILTLIVGAVSLVSGILIGALASRSKEDLRVIRKGVLKLTIPWKECVVEATRWSKAEYAHHKTKVTVILHEVETVSSESRVIIAHVDDSPNSKVTKLAKDAIGNYIPTKDVEWDNPIEYQDEEMVEDVHEEIDKYLTGLEEEIGTFDRSRIRKQLQKEAE
jgi:hypothetical protein